jgi:hypothetical protein
MKKVLNLPFLTKNGLPKKNFQSKTSQQKKYSTNNSGDGGDRNPPQGKLEKPHKLQVKRKRTNSQQEVEQHVPEIEASLEDMDLEVDIENIQFLDDDQILQETQKLAVELVIQEEVFLEEESISVQNALFDKTSRKVFS